MNNFESYTSEENKYENGLSEEDVAHIVQKINNERLIADDDVEYFIITNANGRTFIPKHKYIPVANENGGYSNVEIGEYIKQKLDEYES
ncbi:hypothetical protein COW81_02770 [Candidatus Campbellbacteria bacterium CG22_combo_CG10-13_8_21_14_all_36_13]|uniref:Uncharacterized protein n=1 Tax=Candidatus Campbellbacteria bacterium CG22_combo_CG10-13_8_21_14_all_36_13 TaxID=1974529 RepID=A0A2H0DXR7_9BACT|nr:MAG: hypothetical protein COW81_02770 [Candidatus Campbellbacteria bacterium CG22_combo_CG10-13_8_21_14_all_36_13]